MTLAGLSLAIEADGGQCDHLPGEHASAPGNGQHAGQAAFRGAAKWRCPGGCQPVYAARPGATGGAMPGLGEFLYRPMAAGVAFRDDLGLPLVADVRAGPVGPLSSRLAPRPCRSTQREKMGMRAMVNCSVPRPAAVQQPSARWGLIRRAFARRAAIDRAISWYVRQLDRAPGIDFSSSFRPSDCWRSY